mmetsp:Transcript_91562/g.259240  ORF Transcript_91562/g.259240 Transcript_91562/m.259240 type:complete len:275 (+) Transcript_91562:439-1263(+)
MAACAQRVQDLRDLLPREAEPQRLEARREVVAVQGAGPGGVVPLPEGLPDRAPLQLQPVLDPPHDGVELVVREDRLRVVAPREQLRDRAAEVAVLDPPRAVVVEDLDEARDALGREQVEALDLAGQATPLEAPARVGPEVREGGGGAGDAPRPQGVQHHPQSLEGVGSRGVAHGVVAACFVGAPGREPRKARRAGAGELPLGGRRRVVPQPRRGEDGGQRIPVLRLHGHERAPSERGPAQRLLQYREPPAQRTTPPFPVLSPHLLAPGGHVTQW